MQRYDLGENGDKPYPQDDGAWVEYEDARYLESALRAIQLLIADVLREG